MAENQTWVPLVTEKLTKYINNLGAPNLKFVDVFGLKQELLTQVPIPVCAVFMFFPFTDKAKVSPTGTVQKDGHHLYFIKQEIDNAGVTIAIIHALANSDGNEILKVGPPIKTFLNETQSMTPQERARYLSTDKNMGYFESHGSAEEGKSEAPSADKKVKMNCVTFVRHKGELYEMNGKYDGPVKHKPTTEETLLEDAAEVIKKYMARDPDEVNFTLMALVKK